MKQFEPSEHFVNNTMRKIQQCEYTQKQPAFSKSPLLHIVMQSSIVFGSIVFGIFNLVRLYVTLFAPVVCH